MYSLFCYDFVNATWLESHKSAVGIVNLNDLISIYLYKLWKFSLKKKYRFSELFIIYMLMKYFNQLIFRWRQFKDAHFESNKIN